MTAAVFPPVSMVDWTPNYRLIPSRFPPVSLFDRVASSDELDLVFAVQGLTNPRLRDEVGQIRLVAPEERLLGEGSSVIMAAFCHLNPQGSRFSDGSWGVYYGAESLETAVAEVGHHRERFLAATGEGAIDIDMRAYVSHVVEPLHDLRGEEGLPFHDPDSYAASQRLARELRAAGSWGLAYRSVRRAGGQCVALLRPRALKKPSVQGAHVCLCWDGKRIANWYCKSGLRQLADSASPAAMAAATASPAVPAPTAHTSSAPPSPDA